MIAGLHPVLQALLGGLFTWGLTALGAAGVFLNVKSDNKKLIDFCLGLAAGVMTAASFWSLLAPAIEIAESQVYGITWSWIPVTVGLLLGALFVFGADYAVAAFGIEPPANLVEFLVESDPSVLPATFAIDPPPSEMTNGNVSNNSTKPKKSNKVSDVEMQSTTNSTTNVSTVSSTVQLTRTDTSTATLSLKDKVVLGWRRVVLLIVAITMHNIPEGLAVGVAFAAVGQTPGATFKRAFALALGIGIQNFPEGLAVSLPLVGYGYSKFKAFLFGQASGLVEPIFAVIGAAILVIASPLLPYALAFGAGTMLCVVYDDIVPEGHQNGNGRITSIGAITGFTIMMILDVATGKLDQ